ncbi:hypothetical protein JZM24_08435 [Candidatus Sodalis endolongispinus]|uniref:Tox-PLDMTX domain-containing protein n=1 Tax=Candidatus Sodalis endolongispinus TaxID=2812662 RepID=A0ABS5YAV6_9GAMM|nr:hypothetical protein [Candidatus Sodalis endolongispinus]MBT9432144.1 hypothetical protein [Candidatus Sodalis endolongispinus]
MQDYWMRLGNSKRQFAAFIAQHADILAPSNTHSAFDFKVIECRVLLYWVESEGYREMRHYLLVAEKEGTRYIVDPAAEKLAFLEIPTISQPFIRSEQQWLTVFHQAERETAIRYQTFSSIDAALTYRREEGFHVEEQWLIEPQDVSAIMHYDDVYGIKYSLLTSTYSPLVQQKRLGKIIRNLMIDNDMCPSN